MKRSFSDSDSDEGDFFERDEKDSRGVENESPDASARKRRRGQIEKKRRDRINNSLAELRQLVPAALKKQGSAKLEKAEILQLTVEHLRSLKYGGESVTGLHSTKRALNECITAHQECLAAMVSRDTAHGCQLSPARQQIVNHLNCSAASLSGHNAINPPTTTLVPSKKNTDQELLSSGHIFAPLSSNARDLSKGIEATRSHTIQDWGLSVAVNYPLMLPAQTPSFANVLQAPFNQGSPRIDWSMALIAKTNFTTPFPTRWAP